MECEKCLSPWDTEIHIPKILSCGHTICQNCIKETSQKIITNGEKSFKCPLCNYEIMNTANKAEIMELKENSSLMNLVDKVNTTKNRLNISMSLSNNLNASSFLVNDNSVNINSRDTETNISSNCYYPMCKQHQNKAYFYYMQDKEKKYVCLYCIENNLVNNSEKLIPLPGLAVQNELKIKSCKKKSKILIKEIEKIQLFLEKYHEKFVTENKQKIEELFGYIQQIVDYNHTTALTLYNQCKNEQKSQIDKKIKELISLKDELDSFKNKLDEIINEEKINADTQIELEKIYNRLGNYINYENELSLFQMDININEEAKDSLFDIIQNTFQIKIDFLKMQNGDLPNIKDLLKKNTTWTCVCGEENQDVSQILCNKCSRYRALETYNNILFNPLIASKKEIRDLALRRKHEEEVFKSLLKKNNEIKKIEKDYQESPFYAIDNKWFLKWKSFMTNDLTDKILSNDLKYISDNKKIGVLPPDIIDNSRISTIIDTKNGLYTNENICSYKLKKGLVNGKDYIIINKYLWEWLTVNYNGGPEIKVYANPSNSYTLSPINENSERNQISKDKIKIEEYSKNKNNININKNWMDNDDFKKRIMNSYQHTHNNININANKKKNNGANKNLKKKLTLNKPNNSLKTKKVKTKNIIQKDDSYQSSSNIDSSGDRSKNMSLDVSSNKINPIKNYTFNTKFCPFNNKQSKKTKYFEDLQ